MSQSRHERLAGVALRIRSLTRNAGEPATALTNNEEPPYLHALAKAAHQDAGLRRLVLQVAFYDADESSMQRLEKLVDSYRLCGEAQDELAKTAKRPADDPLHTRRATKAQRQYSHAIENPTAGPSTAPAAPSPAPASNGSQSVTAYASLPPPRPIPADGTPASVCSITSSPIEGPALWPYMNERSRPKLAELVLMKKDPARASLVQPDALVAYLAIVLDKGKVKDCMLEAVAASSGTPSTNASFDECVRIVKEMLPLFKSKPPVCADECIVQAGKVFALIQQGDPNPTHGDANIARLAQWAMQKPVAQKVVHDMVHGILAPHAAITPVQHLEMLLTGIEGLLQKEHLALMQRQVNASIPGVEAEKREELMELKKECNRIIGFLAPPWKVEALRDGCKLAGAADAEMWGERNPSKSPLSSKLAVDAWGIGKNLRKIRDGKPKSWDITVLTERLHRIAKEVGESLAMLKAPNTSTSASDHTVQSPSRPAASESAAPLATSSTSTSNQMGFCGPNPTQDMIPSHSSGSQMTQTTKRELETLALEALGTNSADKRDPLVAKLFECAKADLSLTTLLLDVGNQAGTLEQLTTLERIVACLKGMDEMQQATKDETHGLSNDRALRIESLAREAHRTLRHPTTILYDPLLKTLVEHAHKDRSLLLLLSQFNDGIALPHEYQQVDRILREIEASMVEANCMPQPLQPEPLQRKDPIDADVDFTTRLRDECDRFLVMLSRSPTRQEWEAIQRVTQAALWNLYSNADTPLAQTFRNLRDKHHAELTMVLRDISIGLKTKKNRECLKKHVGRVADTLASKTRAPTPVALESRRPLASQSLTSRPIADPILLHECEVILRAVEPSANKPKRKAAEALALQCWDTVRGNPPPAPHPVSVYFVEQARTCAPFDEVLGWVADGKWTDERRQMLKSYALKALAGGSSKAQSETGPAVLAPNSTHSLDNDLGVDMTDTRSLAAFKANVIQAASKPAAHAVCAGNTNGKADCTTSTAADGPVKLINDASALQVLAVRARAILHHPTLKTEDALLSKIVGHASRSTSFASVLQNVAGAACNALPNASQLAMLQRTVESFAKSIEGTRTDGSDESDGESHPNVAKSRYQHRLNEDAANAADAATSRDTRRVNISGSVHKPLIKYKEHPDTRALSDWKTEPYPLRLLHHTTRTALQKNKLDSAICARCLGPRPLTACDRKLFLVAERLSWPISNTTMGFWDQVPERRSSMGGQLRARHL